MNGRAMVGILASVAALAAASCGSDGDGTDDFVGTWNYTSGTSTTNCGPGTSSTEMVTGSTTLMRGIASALVSVDDGCTIALDVTGNTASARPGQQCSVTEDGTNVTIRFDSYTFTINGIVADESGSATLMGTGPGGVIVNCTYTMSAKLMKVSR
jgi:hypothetical protein